MTYEQTINFIYNIPPSQERQVGRMRTFLEKLGNPDKRLKFVHVAGTNGKGSTCAMLGYILKQAGYTVGTNLSPHVVDFRERFQVNNELISKEDLMRISDKVLFVFNQMKAEGNPPNYFEYVLAIAIEYFVEQKCDIVLLEVGLGGRSDATNVIDAPLVSVITSISVDHIDRLGSSIAGIAKEKAGIIKKGSVTVSYPKQDPEALAELMYACAQQENRLIIPHNCEILDMGIFSSEIIYNGIELRVPFAGIHQIYNALMVIEVCEALKKTYGYKILDQDIKDGLAKSKILSRMEVLSSEPLIILDGAHNESGAEALAKTLELLRGKEIHAVLGILEEKDADSMISKLAPHFASVYTTAIKHNKRFTDPEELATMVKPYCANVHAESNPFEAFLKAVSKAGKNGVVVICGSFYLAGDLRTPITEYLAREAI